MESNSPELIILNSGNCCGSSSPSHYVNPSNIKIDPGENTASNQASSPKRSNADNHSVLPEADKLALKLRIAQLEKELQNEKQSSSDYMIHAGKISFQLEEVRSTMDALRREVEEKTQQITRLGEMEKQIKKEKHEKSQSLPIPIEEQPEYKNQQLAITNLREKLKDARARISALENDSKSSGWAMAARRASERALKQNSYTSKFKKSHLRSLLAATRKEQKHEVGMSKHIGHYCVCGTRCATKSSLRCHILYFTLEPKFQCPWCTERYICWPFLKKHMLRNHKISIVAAGVRGCRVCGDTFPSAYELYRHRKSEHSNPTDAMPVQCLLDTNGRTHLRICMADVGAKLKAVSVRDGATTHISKSFFVSCHLMQISY